MSLNPDIRDQAYQFFIEEAQELLQVLETGLLELRQDHSTPKVHELMRAAHSIKGGAASVELGAIELLAHRLEDFFKALYSDDVELDTELEGLLLQGYDCLAHPLTEQIEAGTFDEETALLTAEPIFAALEVRLEDALKNADNYIPSSNDLGVDIVASIFEVDVEQALSHLKEVAANPTSYNPAEELQGQLEMFAGFAELFNLPGFSEIVQTAQTALNQSPQSAVAIINATVADCAIAQEQILAGDRIQGGSVSPTLMALAQTTTLEDANSFDLESTIVEDEITLDQEHLWSDIPTGELDQPLTEDIFSTFTAENTEEQPVAETDVKTEAVINNNVDEIFSVIPEEEAAVSESTEAEEVIEVILDQEQENLWSNIPTGELDQPLTEDIFSTFTAENTEEQPVAETDVKTEAVINNNVDEIFSVIPEEEAAVSESTEAEEVIEVILDQEQENLWSNIPTDEADQPLTEDIFDTFTAENTEEQPVAETDVETEAVTNNNVDEIFSVIPEEQTAVSESTEAEEVNLDEVQEHLWSDIPTGEPLTEDIFSTFTPENTEEQPVAETEAIVNDDLGEIFDVIPEEQTAVIESTKAEEIILDHEPENLWSDISTDEADQPLAEDIFGTFTAENTEQQPVAETEVVDNDDLGEIFDVIPEEETAVIESTKAEEIILDHEPENLWSDISTDEADQPLAEDIFGTFTAENTEQQPVAETEVVDNDDLGEIFDVIPEEETAVIESTEAEEVILDHEPENLWSDISTDEADQPLAEDIFGTFTAENTEEQPVAETEAVINNNVGEIFSVIPEEETANETNTESIEISDNSESTAAKQILPVDAQPQSENLLAAIESIEDIFDNLPKVANEADALNLPLEKASQSQSQAPVTTTAPQPEKKKKAKVPPKLSVRVDLDRLERMNNLVGELTINRNSLALQNDQLQENVSELGYKFLRFREVTKKLREISDQMLLEQRSQNRSSPPNTNQQSNSTLEFTEEAAEFDSLEMDSYSMLYSSLQEMLEEIVQLEEGVDDITIFAQQSDRTISSQRQMLDQMRDELMWVRMLPLDQILQRFPRTLRELSNKYQKPVELKLSGTGVLVDKAVLEKLSDPLLHLLRNGFDHGIEETSIRTEQGKSATGSIEIKAYYQGNQTVIEVTDDGKGLDLGKITQKGIEQGLITASEAESATRERLFDLIFEPGFSTASKVSELSGRGVGMNIVRSQVETLKGKIGVSSIPGQGSTFTLRLPLTLTIAKLLVCSLGATAFAIPSDSIEEIIIPTSEQIKFANEQRFLSFGNRLIPIYSLKNALPYNCPVLDNNSNSKAFKTIASPEDWLPPLLLLRRGQQLFALEIVSLLSEQELVIKPYGKAISPPSYSYGCTILGDGSLIPAFDGSALISTILGEDIQPISSHSSTSIGMDTVASAMTLEARADDAMVSQFLAKPKITSVKTIMVVDDSTALRRTMALTLEKAGYRVVQKKDGKEALNGFKQNPDLDLIICDVEMPVMNGFEFLGMRRRDSALSKIPTFMLTSRSGAKHRNLAAQLGANGYFTKPYVEQDFVQEVKKILTEKDKSIEQKSQKAIATKSKTILIIDDSSALRRSLSLSLEYRGYRVLQGRDGAEGLEQLRDNVQTDLVICDIAMPNVNGFEFLTACRQEPQLTKIPVIMLTSRNSDQQRDLAISLGATGFFNKPYVEEKFIKEIENYIS